MASGKRWHRRRGWKEIRENLQKERGFRAIKKIGDKEHRQRITKFQEQLLTKKERNPGDGRLDEHKGRYELMSITDGSSASCSHS
ncbi:MAG: hypothetical protein OCU22_08055 [Canidatus Methanoxibalbensis ujae]|nr:hypothetical protein [Candidatus Methanoxibalbensis ujae]